MRAYPLELPVLCEKMLKAYTLTLHCDAHVLSWPLTCGKVRPVRYWPCAARVCRATVTCKPERNPVVLDAAQL